MTAQDLRQQAVSLWYPPSPPHPHWNARTKNPREIILSIATLHHTHPHIISSVQFSLLSDWLAGGTWETSQQRSSSSLFFRRPLWADLAWAGMSILWCCLSSVSSVDHGIAHSPRCLGFGDAVLACDMPNHGSFHLLTYIMIQHKSKEIQFEWNENNHLTWKHFSGSTMSLLQNTVYSTFCLTLWVPQNTEC